MSPSAPPPPSEAAEAGGSQAAAATEQERFEAALRESEARYRTLFESIDDGFCIVEVLLDEAGAPADYRFLEANAAFAPATGLEGAIGRTALELLPGLDRWWIETYGLVALTGEPVRFENHAEAMGRWFDVYAFPFGAPERRQVAIFFKNITARKQAEAERAMLLESERAARAEAERASRLKDDFLAMVSHELRTPLNAILGWAHILARGAADPRKLGEGLAVIERNARSQAQLVEDLLDMSRIASGKIALDIQPFALRDVIEAAIDTVRPGAEAKTIRIERELDSSIGLVHGDPNRMQQVIWNLLSNAVKFTPRGGAVRVTLEPAPAHVAVSVTDTGQGIEPEFLPYVFDRFRQADGSITRRHGGLGLGLSIVKQVVELHGGRVRAESGGEGHGARFVVELPRAAALLPGAPKRLPTAGPDAEDRPALVDVPSLSRLTVLAVDDDKDALLLIRRVLEDRDARVLTASSAAEALDVLRDEPPDVLLSDIGMPDMDGYELIRRVRALGPDAGGAVPAAALTAFARSEDRTRALLAGYQTHMTKPVPPAELIAVVASLAGRTG